MRLCLLHLYGGNTIQLCTFLFNSTFSDFTHIGGLKSATMGVYTRGMGRYSKSGLDLWFC